MMMGTVLSDARFALRALLRRPAFAVTAILTIALGIGANASVFTIVDGFLLTPLPYEDPEELVTLWDENPALGWSDTNISPANAWDWRERAPSLEDLAVFYDDGFNLTGDGPPELVAGLRVTPNVFRLLGRTPALGRDFLPDEMGEGNDRVAILTDGFWKRRFASDPGVLGSTLLLDGIQYTVVGIMPPDFVFLEERPDVFVPIDVHPTEADRDGHYAQAVARLADGVSLERARDEMRDVARQLESEYPDSNEGWTVEVVSAHEDLVGDVAQQASFVLLVAVSFVLLMACVNVANLLLARAHARTREMAVRAALGAGRSRVFRQVLTESTVLAGIGGALGLVLAVWGYRGIAAALPSNIPPVFRFGLDGSVLSWIVGITVASALIFGVAPALRASQAELRSLREGGGSGRGRRSSRIGGTLVVVQTAMAVILLVGGGLLMKSLSGMRNQDFGFDPENVLTVRIAPPSAEYPEGEDLRAFWSAVEDRVRALPEVVAAGRTQSHPLMGSNWGRTIRIEGQGDVDRTVRLTYASPGLFDALGFRILQGRGITDEDDEDAPTVAVVNENFVDRYLGPGQDPLTTTITSGEASIPIVGVIHDVVERGVDDPPEPSIYTSINQAEVRTASLVVHTAGPPTQAVSSVQQAVWSVDPDIPLYDVETMESLVDRRIGGFAIIGYMMGTFALLSLILGAVGIYGVTAYAAGQRTGEIGVRVAMGAERSDVIRMVVSQGSRRAVLGLAIGLLGAFLLTGAMERILIGVSPRDPVTFLGVAAVLAAVSFLGLYLPARRAARVDPVRALGSE